MRTDLYGDEPVESGGPWPAPLGEAELLSRVHLRGRRIRRRRVAMRVLPPAAIGMAAVLGLIAIAGGGVSTHVMAQHPASGPDGGQPADATTTTSPSTTTTTSSGPAVATGVKPPTYVESPATGRLSVTPPPAPVYATKHPLLTDPTGDAQINTPSGAQNDPSVDITDVDVTAVASGLTATMHVSDLSAAPVPSLTGPATMQEWWFSLTRDDGHFTLDVTRDVNSGAVTGSATFWRPNASTDSAGSSAGFHVSNPGVSIDVAKDAVSVYLSFADMNAAMAQDTAEPHQPIGLGSPVGLQSAATEHYTADTGGTGDTANPTDPAFTYRLGD